MNNCTCDIFYKSYEKDFKLLKYSLMSLLKNVTGYNRIIILIPESDWLLCEKRIEPLLGSKLNESVFIFYVQEYGKGYLFQQFCKMNAWRYSESEYILFSDSDCIFDHQIDLQDFIKDDKPEILYTSWDKVGDAICWKEPTQKFLEENIEWEFMRRNCLIYHRSTLENITLQYPNIEKHIMTSERFSEFNVIGAYAFKHEKDKYNFINTDNWLYVRPKSEQLWSLASKSGSEIHQREYQRSLKVINEVLGLNLKKL